MQVIAPNVYIETLYPPITVGAVLTSEGWVVIDTPPMPSHAQLWRQTLAEISDKPINYLICTDAQRERVLGNGWFEAPLITHETAAQQMLALKATFLSQAADDLSKNNNEMVAIASLNLILPQVSYSDSVTIHSGEHEITVMHRPGAYYGNSWVLLASERVLFAGDSLILRLPPVIGDGISKKWLQSLAELRTDYTDWTLVPGRGEPATSDAAAQLADTLSDIRQRISELLRAGRARSEVASLVPEIISPFSLEPALRDEMQRRVRSALEAVYDEMRATGGEDDPTGEDAV